MPAHLNTTTMSYLQFGNSYFTEVGRRRLNSCMWTMTYRKPTFCPPLYPISEITNLAEGDDLYFRTFFLLNSLATLSGTCTICHFVGIQCRYMVFEVVFIELPFKASITHMVRWPLRTRRRQGHIRMQELHSKYASLPLNYQVAPILEDHLYDKICKASSNRKFSYFKLQSTLWFKSSFISNTAFRKHYDHTSTDHASFAATLFASPTLPTVTGKNNSNYSCLDKTFSIQWFTQLLDQDIPL